MSEGKKLQFPVEALPAWCIRHGVKVHPLIKAANIEGLGNGWIIHQDDGLLGNGDEVALLSIPREVILSSAYVREYANENEPFRQLVEALPEFSVSE
jgi:hypothetical protein